MYNSTSVAERIKAQAKLRNVSVKKLLEDVGLGINTMANMKTSMPKSDNLARIADYLDCSVDYLLGRTDDPGAVRNFDNEPIPLNSSDPIKELVDVCSNMDVSQQSTVLAFAKFLSSGGVAPLTAEEMLAEAK